ncbi:GYD domain-containing protein [Limobrevibacterium gyesilva]|uniref:GYD domain-containing protein n=1 Tax=Limobrevibacterium gyesilva TaxID=2991712 RepID=A0AA41YUC4_9PROT|nr:GYD domain-containing protein [Limobrevibacterium gyesilva]MCW3476738.1 GYD domain-containing protein [Limobrevibacterium gyesilva]
MPKFLIKASYTTEGMKGLKKDKASGREKAVASACEALGGKLDALYYALGDDDAFAVVDLPSRVHVASLGVAVCASGMASTRTVPLLTVAEMDKALGEDAKYRPPGS